MMGRCSRGNGMRDLYGYARDVSAVTPLECEQMCVALHRINTAPVHSSRLEDDESQMYL